MNKIISEEIVAKGADQVHFVDISDINAFTLVKYNYAILIVKFLSPQFIQNVTRNPAYVADLKKKGDFSNDEFTQTEKETDAIADYLSSYLNQKGFTSFSQSENNLLNHHHYDEQNMTAPLPHKTIALRANLGWIGKNNLLVSKKYGCAISMSSVLTNAPVRSNPFDLPKYDCGNCNSCVQICPSNCIFGIAWEANLKRDSRINVKQCTTCLLCLTHCSYTQKYMSENIDL